MGNLREELERVAHVLGVKERQEQEEIRRRDELAQSAVLKREEESRERERSNQELAQLKRSIRDIVIEKIIQPSIDDLVNFLNQGVDRVSDRWTSRSVRSYFKYSIAQYSSGGYDETGGYTGEKYFAILYDGYLLSRLDKVPRRKSRDGLVFVPQDPNYPDSTQVSHGWKSNYQHFFVGFSSVVETGPELSETDLDLGLNISRINFLIGIGQHQLLTDTLLFKDLDKYDKAAGFAGNATFIDISSRHEDLRELQDDNSPKFKDTRDKINRGLIDFSSAQLPDFPRM